ncbi:hypothetical protein [Noviherbaspirillum humi]|uniref:hypothetical protein n=1 Tax=Noviherbaspirillum humi TaxID=1688639 RepID=UPI0011608D03|nr:hypothetical protein [Noviherbaspirillum humi]
MEVSVKPVTHSNTSSPSRGKRSVPEVRACPQSNYVEAKKKQEQGAVVTTIAIMAMGAGTRPPNPYLLGGGFVAVAGGTLWTYIGKKDQQAFDDCNSRKPSLEQMAR